MTTSLSLRALAAAAALAIGTLPLAATPATARPFGPEDSAGSTSHTYNSECRLQRIDRQFVRCGDLSGAGVSAPVWVPEYRL
jgi:hypothetical protein